MPRRRAEEGTPPEPTAELAEAASAVGAKYPRPKILVVDDPDIASALQGQGYAASLGSFGQPFLVDKGSGYLPAGTSGATLPGYTEQEIVVANLKEPEPVALRGEQIELPGPGVSVVWAPTASGLIDPRPHVMWRVKDAMDRIYKHGGVFILFGVNSFAPGYIINSIDRFGNLDNYGARSLNVTNWGLLSELDWLIVTHDNGEEMDVAANGTARALGIENYFNSGHFECTIKPHPAIQNRWVTLAANKFGEPVAGLVFPGADSAGNVSAPIFIFPQLEHRAELVSELVDRILPRLAARLFPYSEKTSWTRLPEYDLPRVSELQNEIVRLQESMRTRVRELEEKIEAERAQYGFLHDLLTASGDDLVRAVVQALRTIGFKEVVDVDAAAKAAGEGGPLREDVRIMDAPAPVLVEIKGISGKPKEASSLQVAKYLIPRMKEWDRTDLHGLAIVNHQRNLPALDRDNDHLFQPDVLSNAQDLGFGLLTTWDLFRLARGFIAHGWHADDVASLFMMPGRVQPIPVHYEFIGIVHECWPRASALGIRLDSGTLGVGNRVAYESPVDFIEEDVISLQLDGKDVAQASAGDYIGIRTKLTKHQARDGLRVYRVNRHSATVGEHQVR
jgi:hypothetical protein